MGDLKNPKIIILKGFLFLALGVLASSILLMFAPSFYVAALLAMAIWAFCRFYYFCFYVIENYVDSQYRFSGILDAIRFSLRRLSAKQPRDSDSPRWSRDAEGDEAEERSSRPGER